MQYIAWHELVFSEGWYMDDDCDDNDNHFACYFISHT